MSEAPPRLDLRNSLQRLSRPPTPRSVRLDVETPPWGRCYVHARCGGDLVDTFNEQYNMKSVSMKAQRRVPSGAYRQAPMRLRPTVLIGTGPWQSSSTGVCMDSAIMPASPSRCVFWIRVLPVVLEGESSRRHGSVAVERHG